MDFSEALVELRLGRRIAPGRWAGTGKHIFYRPGMVVPLNEEAARDLGLPRGSKATFNPYILKRTGDGSYVPWVPTQGDILGNDWSVV